MKLFNKYIIATLLSLCFSVSLFAQTQTLGINQSATGNPTNSCGACYTIAVQYSISNVAATGTVITCTFPNNKFDLCGAGGASVSSSGTTTTLTFNLGYLAAGTSSSVNYQIRWKLGVTCNGTTGTTTAQISTIQTPTPVVSTPLTLTANSTEAWSIAKYIKYGGYDWYSGYTAGSPFNYSVSVCGGMFDVYYHIRLTNTGCINVTGASITDVLPAGASVVNVYKNSILPANIIPYTGVGTITWNAGNLSNTLDAAATNYYDYYVHVQFPAAMAGQVKCNQATLNGTNFCTAAPKTATSLSECIKLINTPTGTSCGTFGTPYYLNYTPYFFIGCPAWLDISVGQTGQCAGGYTTMNNIGYSTPIPGAMHVDSFRLNALTAGQTVTITVNTTGCGTFTQTYTGPTAAQTINFYAAPFSIPPACTITNFAISSNIGITGNAAYSFGQMWFTILTTTWNTLAPVNPATTIAMTGANYTSTLGSLSCVPAFTTSAKVAKIETVKDICYPYQYYSCLNPDDTITYSIAVQNYGTANFSGGSIRDVLPVGLEYVPNSSTFSTYTQTGFNKCNATNQPGTGITVAHAELTSTTNLRWNLPTLTADCNNKSNWYVINFKAKVTMAAPPNLLANHEDCFDGSNTVVPEFWTYNNNAYIYICTRKVDLEVTKFVSKDSINWDSCISVTPGSRVYYRLKIKNPGNIPFTNIRLMDFLPSIGDKYVVNCLSRGSTMPIYLTSALALGNASTIEYATNPLPTRGAYLNLSPDYTIPCNTAATWQVAAAIPATPANMMLRKSIRIDFASYVLGAGQTELFDFSAQVPPGATAGMVGWNSFAATASQDAVQSLGAEATKVCVNIIDTGCGCIGNFVWFDTNGNGLQDSGEPGINGCTITLYDASNNQVGMPVISSFNIGGQPGYYQFCGLTAGTYHIAVTPPAGYMLSIQNNSNPALNSDVDPNTMISANFTFNCQDNNDIDVGLVNDDGCKCAQSHWGTININDNPIIIDHLPNDVNAKATPQAKVSNVGVPINPLPLPGFSLNLSCGKKDTVTLKCKTTYNFVANYICVPANCGSSQIVITTPSGSTTTFTNVASFFTNDGGYYKVKIYGKCGNKICDSCTFIFKVVCPICPCDYKISVTPTTGSNTYVTSNPKYTLHSRNFNVSVLPPGTLFTQVRAEVVSYGVTSAFNNECLSCKNMPYSWGSIYNASDINTNVAVKDSVNMGTNPPQLQFVPSLTNVHQNPRETIWSDYSGFTMPSTLNMQFVLPHPSLISCCTLYVRICVKFTFRDRNCKECEVVSCFVVAIPPVSGGIDNPTGAGGIDNPTGITPKTQAKAVQDCATCGYTTNNTDAQDEQQQALEMLKATEKTSVTSKENLEQTIKSLEQKIAELKKLKEAGSVRGDVELLPMLEKELQKLKEQLKK